MGLLDEGSNLLFRIVLTLHTVATGFAAVFLAIHYLDKPDNDKYSTADLVNAAVAMVALANFLLSLLNTGVEWLYGGEKVRLEIAILNNARNIMTGTCLILGSALLGIEGGTSTEADIYTSISFTLIVATRLLDTMLDVGGLGIAVQCPDKVERSEKLQGKLDSSKLKAFGSKAMISIFAFLCLGSALVMWFVYIGDIQLDFGSTESDDDTLLFVTFWTILLHELLILLTILLSIKAFEAKFLEILGKKDCGDGITAHSLNEIPIVSAIVFTYNLLALSMIAGMRIQDDVSINLLGAMIAIIGLAEVAGRRLI